MKQTPTRSWSNYNNN